MSPMTFVFRVDSSLVMGSGHVMRCLTLAIALRDAGAKCYFMCRRDAGNLIDFIEEKGFHVFVVAPLIYRNRKSDNADILKLDHADWLEGSQENDADACRSILKDLNCDWLVVDHYALDIRWERMLGQEYKRLFVIDDLADRQHYCDLLLDQNLDASASRYSGLTPPGAMLLLGPQYSLLRPDFFSFRELSLTRRHHSPATHIVISMGGVDIHNATGLVIKGLGQKRLDPRLKFTVIMGGLSPWIGQVRKAAELSAASIEVLVGVTDMAELLATADLVIGAAGSSSWERCCLGVPTMLVVLADNQQPIANALSAAGAAVSLGYPSDEGFLENLQLVLDRWCSNPHLLKEISRLASSVTDGLGTERVISQLMVH